MSQGSQRWLAALVGVNQSQIARWELGRQTINPVHVALLATALGVTEAELEIAADQVRTENPPGRLPSLVERIEAPAPGTLPVATRVAGVRS